MYGFGAGHDTRPPTRFRGPLYTPSRQVWSRLTP